MIYTITKSVPANTPVDGAIQYKLAVTGGLVYQVDVYFPPGPSGLLGLSICDGGYQVWPSERGEWFFGDNISISFPDRYYISSPNKVLDVYAYNLDDTYEHLFQVRVGLASDPAVISSFLPSLGTNDIAQSIADLLVAQDQSYEAQRQRAIAAAEAAGVTE